MRLILFIASLLILPLAGLLFAQWPLREVVQAGSRLANDVAQIIFAVYAAVAVTAASRAGTHLAAGRPAGPSSQPRWRAVALLLCVGPWSLFMLWAAFPVLRDATMGMERFSETLSPGYFIIKLALGLMLALVLADALVQAWPRKRRTP
ncbi:MAG: C4-dicarboxylate ABC transporter substrate-binding protein [Bdellovibrionales bacterium]|nr:C4-dicarboxylate ABC transporter substrate-binding protein [Ramlibacter sp.]